MAPDHPHHSIVRTLLGLACLLALAMGGYRAYQVWKQPRWIPDADGGGHWTRWPCEPDAEELCPNLSPGDGRITRCLRDHSNRLSTPCAAFLEDIDPSDVWSNVCRQELDTFCNGRRYPMRCLEENVNRLSPRCADRLKRFRAGSHWRLACAADAEALCRDVAATESAATSCLKAHENELSPSCRVYYSINR